MALEQKVELDGMSSSLMSAQQFMDPRPSAALNVNDPSVSDDKTAREVSVSPANTAEVISKEHEHPMIKIPGKQAFNKEDGGDQTSQSWGSPRSPNLDQAKNEEQASEAPFRKARVSVRARSEAPLVRIKKYFHSYHIYFQNL